jgi:intracellular multiplication protein IcmP
MPPPAPQPQGGGNQSDNSYGFLWIVVALMVGILILWYTEHEIITAIIFKLRLAEISVVQLFSNSLDATRAQILAMAPENANFEFIDKVSVAVGSVLAIPFAVILAVLAFLLYRSSINNRFRKIHSMKTLMEQEQNNWPQITPVSKLDLVNQHVHEGAWAMAMTPMQFAKKYKLLTEERVPDSTGLSSRYKIIAKVTESKATRAFTNQLGRPWRGIDKLPIHAQALFAIFAAKAEGDRENANKLLRQIAASAADTGKLNFTGVNVLLKKHKDTKLIKRVTSSHAYELTVMASMLELSRLDGVLATAEFLWLKPVDRPLWYMLNNVGRRTAFTEVAGPMAHWLAEKVIGRKLIVPMVNEATIALVAALEEVVYNPDKDY